MMINMTDITSIYVIYKILEKKSISTKIPDFEIFTKKRLIFQILNQVIKMDDTSIFLFSISFHLLFNGFTFPWRQLIFVFDSLLKNMCSLFLMSHKKLWFRRRNICCRDIIFCLFLLHLWFRFWFWFWFWSRRLRYVCCRN